jgi:anaerobic selenocysteine-containing dehydrogenase
MIAEVSCYDATWNAANGGTNGIAYKRTGNSKWTKVTLDSALADIASTLVAKRNAGTSSRDGGSTTDTTGGSTWATTTVPGKNATAVQFYGSSHINNEQNYLYRKLIANFGTSRVEHQARI